VVCFYPSPKPPVRGLEKAEGGTGVVELEPAPKVFVAEKGRIEEMAMEEYLIGVVAGEMPAQFEEEALKAQAVAARTYTLKRLRAGGGSGCPLHPEADICTDPNCCQAFLDQDKLRRRWGLFSYFNYRAKIAAAVAATSGLILTYDQGLIDPLYHASCGGLGTEDAEAVWGNAVPYLKPVHCHCGAQSPHVGVETVFTMAELEQGLGGEVVLPASGGAFLEVLERTASGRVYKLQVGQLTLAGTELRRRLGLNSTDFSWRVADAGNIVFITQGKGHGVGMCQYGANALAKKGYDFKAILQHYYTGVEIGPPAAIDPGQN
ncbi:MAG TPA: stage II sporulation protein D, partial [bacterium]|nr:stage II sporulation protein D [bacterium]